MEKSCSIFGTINYFLFYIISFETRDDIWLLALEVEKNFDYTIWILIISFARETRSTSRYSKGNNFWIFCIICKTGYYIHNRPNLATYCK